MNDIITDIKALQEETLLNLQNSKAKNKPSFIGTECIPQAIKIGWSIIDISIKDDQIILIIINIFFILYILTYWQHKQLNILLTIINGYQ